MQPQVCITKDNTQVQIDGVVFFQVTDPKLASYGTADFQMAIVQLAQTSLRSECGKRELDRQLEERNDINRAVIAALDEASPNWGVKESAVTAAITPPAAWKQETPKSRKNTSRRSAILPSRAIP